jgi:hypothetical protein
VPHDRGLVELDVVGQDRDRVRGAQPDVIGDLVGPADDQPVDVGEPGLGGERRAAVDHDGLVAELLREPDERAGHLDGADDHEPRPDGYDSMNSWRPPTSTVFGHGMGERVGRCRDELRVEIRIAQRPVEAAVVVDHERGRRLVSVTRLVRAEHGRRRIRGERRHDRPPVAAALARLARRLDGRGRDAGRDQDVDRAAAR